MNCITCGNPAKISILLAVGPHGNPENDTERWYLPNQIARQEDHLTETWFCSTCMRTLEDNFRATLLYLQVENGMVIPKKCRG